LLLDYLVKCLTRTQHGIPPHAEAFPDEGLSNVPGRGPVFSAVREENVSSGHVNPLDRTDFRRPLPGHRNAPLAHPDVDALR
jgi:hypothetical protein